MFEMGLEGYQGSQLSDGLSTCLIATDWEAVFDSNLIPVQPSVCSDLQIVPADHKIGKNVHRMTQIDFILSSCLLVAFPRAVGSVKTADVGHWTSGCGSFACKSSITRALFFMSLCSGAISTAPFSFSSPRPCSFSFGVHPFPPLSPRPFSEQLH